MTRTIATATISCQLAQCAKFYPIDKFRTSIYTFLVNSLSENLTLASKTRHSEMSDDSNSLEVKRSDVEYFEALPDDTVEAIGSTESAIRKIIWKNQETTDVVKYGALQNEIFNMGLDESIRPFGSRTMEGVFCKKEADESYGPTQPVLGRNPKWPTVVVEVGVSESYRKLRADAEWWLMNSRGDVKLIIIVSISQKTPNVKFETITLDPTVSSLR
ncbi:unnamed protein product [Penicillium glandicola]